MLDPQSFFEDLVPRNLERQIAAALPEDVVVVFHIQGDGGGAWQVARQAASAAVGPRTEGPKDCEIWCSAEDFIAILEGRLDARLAFMEGRVRAVGDLGLALRLQGAVAPAA